MKVLLCEDVEKLGWLGDVVEVTEGYARNFLLPQRLAIVPTEGNLKSLAREKAIRAEKRQLFRKEMEGVAKAIEGAEAVIAAKSNELGHLFGSITANQIAENLRQQGFEVQDKMIVISEHIKEVGTKDVKIRFAEDLTAQVKVTVVPDATSPPIIKEETLEEEVSDTSGQAESKG